MENLDHTDPNGHPDPNPDTRGDNYMDSEFQRQCSYQYNVPHHDPAREERNTMELLEAASNEAAYNPTAADLVSSSTRERDYDESEQFNHPSPKCPLKTDDVTSSEDRGAVARLVGMDEGDGPSNISGVESSGPKENPGSSFTEAEPIEERTLQIKPIEDHDSTPALNSPSPKESENSVHKNNNEQNSEEDGNTNVSPDSEEQNKPQDHMRDLQPFLDDLNTTSQEKTAISSLLEVSQQIPIPQSINKDAEKTVEESQDTRSSKNDEDSELVENDKQQPNPDLESDGTEESGRSPIVNSEKPEFLEEEETISEEEGGFQQEEDSCHVKNEDSSSMTNVIDKPVLASQEASQKVQYEVCKALETVCRQVLMADKFIYITGDLSFRIDDKSLLKMTVDHNVDSPSGRVFRSRSRSRKNTAPLKKTSDIYDDELSNDGFEGTVVPTGDDLLDKLNQDLLETTRVSKRKMWYNCEKCNYSTKHVGFYKKHLRTKHGRNSESVGVVKIKKEPIVGKRPRGRPRKQARPVILDDFSEPDTPPEADLPSDNDEYIPDHNPEVNDDTGESPSMKTRSASSSSTGKFKCEECPYTTDHSGRFKDHLNKHRGVRPFSCTICSKSFLRQDDLKKHEETHNRRYECSMCASEFPERSQLKEHMKVVHNEEGRLQLFPCDICKKNLSNHADLEKHMEAKHNHICRNCGETFTRLDRLRKHKNEQHPNEALTCTICLQVCASKGALRKHMHRHRAGNKFPCDICGRTFTAQSTLYHHKRGVHSNLKPYQCSKCDKRFNFHHSLKLHVLQHDGVRPYKCDSCDKTYLTATHLKSHKQAVHEDKKKYLCVVCNKRFPYENSLKMHMMLHTGDRPYLCNICGRGFINHSALKTHEASHVDSKQWECEICKKMYKTEALLRAHRRRHTGEGSRFMCDICGHTFMYKSNLEAHYTVHSNERKYTCKECGSTFKTAATLYSHRLVHSTETPYTCTVCSKAFKSKERKLAHERRHLGDKPFQCEICGRSFPDKGGLTKHCKTVHCKTKKFSCPVCKKSCSRADNLRVHMRIHRDPSLLKLDWKSLMTDDMDGGEDLDLSFDEGQVAGGGMSGDGRRDQQHGVGSGGGTMPAMMSSVTSAQSDVPTMSINTSASSVHHHMPVQAIDHRHGHGHSNDLRHPTPADMAQANDHRQPTDLRQHAHRHPGHHHASSHMQGVLVVPDPNLPPHHHHHHHPHHHPMNPGGSGGGGGGGGGGVQQHHSQVLQPPHSLPAPPPAHHQQPNHPLQAQDYDSLGPMPQDPLRAIPVVMPPAAHSSADDGSQGLQPPMSHHMRDYAEVANAMLFMQYQNLQNSHQQ